MAFIRKRGKTYSYTVDLGVDPVTGKRKQVHKGGFHRKKDAEAAARKIEMALDEALFIEPSKKKFAAFIIEWFDGHYQNRIKNTTVVSRRYLIEKHLLQNNSMLNKEISKITTADIDALYNQKLAEGYSTSYVRQIHQIVNKAFSQAVKWNEINSNPAAEADPPSIRKPEIEIWSKDHVRSFLDACKNERHYITFLLAISTGMRRGELLGLRWCDIDLNEGIIRVNKSLANIPGKGHELSSLKTRSAKRHINLHDTVVEDLRKHKENQDEWKKVVRNLYEDRDLVICTDTGAFQDPRNVIRIMKRIIKTANVPSIRFHDLRHTHASIMISMGMDIVWVSARLGHANPKVTLEYYAHLIPGHRNELVDIFQITREDECEDSGEEK